MIEGLQLLPRLRAMQEKQMDDGDPYAPALGNCAKCMYGFEMTMAGGKRWEPGFPRHVRAAWGCGYLPESERGDDTLDPPGGPNATICAGYTTSLPEVGEAAVALGWRKDGALKDWLGDRELSEPLKQAIDILAVAVKETESETIKRRREEAEANRGTR